MLDLYVFGGFYMRTFVACLIFMSLVVSTYAHVRGMLDLYIFGGFYMRTFVACLIFMFWWFLHAHIRGIA